MLLQFPKNLKLETIIFGDFNVKTLENDKAKTGYCNVLMAYDFDVRISFPTRVTPTSRSCIDHFSTQYQLKLKQLKLQLVITTLSLHSCIVKQQIPRK